MGAGAALGRTLWGVLGLGAFGFQLQEVPDGKRIITTTRSHSNKLVTCAVQAMDPHDVIKVGGAGNKVGQSLIFSKYFGVFVGIGWNLLLKNREIKLETIVC